ncbi:MAG: type II secretion system protein [Nitrospirae bacterium]|nr:type II secretion system protein [Nitrospirota bacterium]
MARSKKFSLPKKGLNFILHPSSFSLQKGFTLLEIMIALAIVGGLLVTLIYSMNYHLGIAQRHEFITVASLLAKNKLAELEDSPLNVKGDFPEPHAAYHFAAEVRDSSYPGISEIIVTVTKGDEEVKFRELMERAKLKDEL